MRLARWQAAMRATCLCCVRQQSWHTMQCLPGRFESLSSSRGSCERKHTDSLHTSYTNASGLNPQTLSAQVCAAQQLCPFCSRLVRMSRSRVPNMHNLRHNRRLVFFIPQLKHASICAARCLVLW